MKHESVIKVELPERGDVEFDKKVDLEMHNWLVEFGILLPRDRAEELVKQKEKEKLSENLESNVKNVAKISSVKRKRK